MFHLSPNLQTPLKSVNETQDAHFFLLSIGGDIQNL